MKIRFRLLSLASKVYLVTLTALSVGYASTSFADERAPAPSLIYFNGTSYDGADSKLAVQELKVEEAVDGTYWAALTWSTGYMGLQQGGAGGYHRHVHFSIWDPADGGETFLSGTQNPNTQGGRFGGEGTGVVTYYPFEWQVGTLYRFAISAEPYDGGTEYKGYFQDASWRYWCLIATIRRPRAPAYLGYVGAFLEDFAATSGSRRSGLFGNAWLRNDQQVFHQPTQIYFNASIANPLHQNFDGDVVGSRFRLETGGDTVKDTDILTLQSLSPGSMEFPPVAFSPPGAHETQTQFVGTLDGASYSSTFQTGGLDLLPTLGWINLLGTAQVYGLSNNGLLVGTTGYGNYAVEFNTGVAIQPGKQYALTFGAGFIANLGGGVAQYQAQIGTNVNNVFVPLAQGRGSVVYYGNIAAIAAQDVAPLSYLAGANDSGDLVVRLAQTGTTGAPYSDFFGFDNFRLAVRDPMISPAEELAVGWNLLGNSVNAALDVTTAFGDPAKVSSVWKWIAAAGNWAFYTPSLPDGGAAYAASKGLYFLTTINGGEGFWVNAKQTFTVSLPTGSVVLASDFQNQSAPPNKLPTGWSLISIGDTKTPSDFNKAVDVVSPPMETVPTNLTTIWAWDATQQKWYFYAPSLEAQGGTALSDYITSHGYLDFTSANKTFGTGVGFWVNKP